MILTIPKPAIQFFIGAQLFIFANRNDLRKEGNEKEL
jgi:hypothetical protein